jgi:2-polyprenyl-3-methyl-5-hydroxy-6-metoxy-1,4-benzoquinol methylase
MAKPLAPLWWAPLGWLGILHPGGFDAIGANIFHLPWPKKAGRQKPRLLEVGCGNGQHLLRMQCLGWSVQGTDLDERVALAGRNLGLRVEAGSLGSLPFEPQSFDAIVLNHVIEHVSDPVQEMKRCYELLVPGGLVSVATPNGTSHGCKSFREAWRGLEPPRHFAILNRRALRLVAETSGFEILTCRDRISANAFFRWQSETIAKAIEAGNKPAHFSNGIRLSDWLWQYFCRSLQYIKQDLGEETILLGRRPADALKSIGKGASPGVI